MYNHISETKGSNIHTLVHDMSDNTRARARVRVCVCVCTSILLIKLGIAFQDCSIRVICIYLLRSDCSI